MSAAAPTFLSVFTGIGGFDLGLERSGWRCAGQIEVDPFCTRVLARHWPNVPRWGDVRSVAVPREHRRQGLSEQRRSGAAELAEGCADAPWRSGSIDLLCGGFPCQDLSVAGRRAGLSAARSGLFFEFVRLASELRPRWLLLENVPGLFSSNGGRDFALILHTLDQLGYGVSWRVLDSRYFGVPQRRRRVFLVGHLGAACPIEVLFEPEGGERDSAPGGEAGEDVAYCLAASAGGSKFGSGRDSQDTFIIGQNGSDVQVSHELGALTSGQARQTSGDVIAFAWQQGTAAEKDRAYIVRAGDYAGALSNTRQDAVAIAGAQSASNTRHTSGLKSEADLLAYQCQGTNVGPMGALRRGNGNETGGVPFASAGSAVRRLSPTECERLQGFPDGWSCLCGVEPYSTASCRCPDSPRYAALGNAVTVNVITWLGQRLLAAHNERMP